MTKRLVVQVIETAGGGGLYWIAEQSHRGHEFGCFGSATFKAKNGHLLTSSDRPGASAGTLCVRGSDRSQDLRAEWVNGTHIARIREAVADYNAHFADKPEVDAPSIPPIVTFS